MTEAQDNFRKWFAEPLQQLNANGDAAFAVMMITFPLLERYLREKSGVVEGDLNDSFHDEFYRIFSAPSRHLVPKLWHSYRNGLLHQATFSKKNKYGKVMPSSFITSRVALIEYDGGDDAFFVNPKAFSEKVIATIQADFSVFEATSSSYHPLPQIHSTPPTFLPDGGPPPSGVM